MRFSKWLVAAGFLMLAPVAAVGTEFKIATVLPENTSWMKEMRAAAAEVRERSDGRVTFKFYSGGVQGSPEQVLRKIKIGQLHGGAFTPTDLQQVYSDLNIYGLPFLFSSEDEANYVRERVDPALIRGLEEAGFASFGFATGGFARVMSNVPVRSHADLKGRKVWVPEGDRISYRAMQALDLSPVTLPLTDVLTGLQTGLIEIVTMSPAGALVLQWHTKVDYLTRMPIVYSMGLLAIQSRAFERLSPSDQAIVREVMSDLYTEWNRENSQDADEALKALLNSGIEPVEPAEGAHARLQALMYENNRAMARSGLFSMKLLEEILGHIEDYRRERGAADAVAAQ